MAYQKGDRVVLDEHGQEHAGTVSELRDGYMMIEWDNGSLPSPLEAEDVRPMADGEVIAPPTLDPVVEASKAFQAALADGATREQAATVWEESYDRLSDLDRRISLGELYDQAEANVQAAQDEYEAGL